MFRIESSTPAPELPVWDRRVWFWIAPVAVVGFAVVWSGISGTLPFGFFILLEVLLAVACSTPGLALWFAVDDAKKGYTRGHAWERQLYSLVPLVVAVAVLVIAAMLTKVHPAQLILSVGLILLAALPSAGYAAIKIHQNRNLPYVNPRTPLER